MGSYERALLQFTTNNMEPTAEDIVYLEKLKTHDLQMHLMNQDKRLAALCVPPRLQKHFTDPVKTSITKLISEDHKLYVIHGHNSEIVGVQLAAHFAKKHYGYWTYARKIRSELEQAKNLCDEDFRRILGTSMFLCIQVLYSADIDSENFDFLLRRRFDEDLYTFLFADHEDIPKLRILKSAKFIEVKP